MRWLLDEGCRWDTSTISSAHAFSCLFIGAASLLLAGVGCGPPGDGGGEVRLVDDTGGDASPEAGAPDAGSDTDGAGEADGSSNGGIDPRLPYAAGVVEFSQGSGAGTGQERMPDVVLGPPDGKGPNRGSLDVLSLGAEGEIIVDFGDRTIVDEEGADFIVYENPFYVSGDPEQVYEELGEVSVSADGETWKTYDCETEPVEPGRWPGCAGWRPVEEYDAESTVPPEPAVTGGDPFDLAEIGVEEARYVRIRDVSRKGSSPSVGFDLDAVGVVNGRREGGSQ